MTTSGIYDEWTPRPHRVLLRDPDGVTRWVSVTAAIGPYDAQNQAQLSWPESEVVKVKDGPDLEEHGR